eukprot:351282-Chlamydomonas_euryale.AAC.2
MQTVLGAANMVVGMGTHAGGLKHAGFHHPGAPTCRCLSHSLPIPPPFASADGAGRGQNGDGDGQAPGRSQGHGHIPRRHHHCRAARAGACGHARRIHERRRRRARRAAPIWQVRRGGVCSCGDGRTVMLKLPARTCACSCGQL